MDPLNIISNIFQCLSQARNDLKPLTYKFHLITYSEIAQRPTAVTETACVSVFVASEELSLGFEDTEEWF